ncbi:hypothetical protein [Sediminitomix flava]|uniref:Uncharacterized protein n=1 Tax=Sediminitomix flava TaxID=379075 RepID=A0A315YXY7_SEDFL|nr:hypothetical protein [Sediminitomix flava]PWJ34992.1 hypothetical protein BC781_11033 [Sediminitomix flava]
MYFNIDMMIEHLEKLRSEEQYKKYVRQANKRFEWKPFSQRFSSFWVLSKISKRTLPVISIITSIYFLLNFVFEGIPQYLAIPISVLILCGWEYAKARFLQISSENYYNSHTSSLFFILLTLCFTSGSIWMSANGAKEIVYSFNDKSKEIKGSYEEELLKLENKHSNDLENLRESKSDFYENNKVYLGNSKYALNPKAASTYALFDQRIFELEDEFKIEKEKLSSIWVHNNRDYEILQKEKSWVFFIIAAIFDLLIILSGWFLVWFDYKVLKEDQELQQLETNDSNTNVVDNEQPLIFKSTEKDDSIDFSLPSPPITPKKMIDESIYAQKDEESNHEITLDTPQSGLEAAIQLGIRDYKYLMKTFKCNVQTVKAAINRYEELNAPKEMKAS